MKNFITQLFGRNAKVFAAMVTQGLVLAQEVWGHQNDWILLATAIAGVLGVWTVPNTSPQPLQHSTVP